MLPALPGAAGRRPGLTVERLYTTPGVHPYDEVTWERRDVVQTNWRTGETVFEQRGAEFPDFWSVNASTIVTSKYFRGATGSVERESSLRQLIDRVVLTYVKAGKDNGYFATPDDAEVFEHELTWMLLHQVFSFNSPVWFNVGTTSPQQVSACFILAVDDNMDSILNWYREEGLIFKGGSGSGLNISRIRSSKELLRSSGGTASGPVSFMRGADASAGTIKSGGATRRAAKMVVLDVDHPDIEEFVSTKAREEDKIRVLRDAGFDMDLGGHDIVSVQYQNANNSVRVSDDFMRAVEEGGDFGLRARTNGEVIETVDAQRLWGDIAQAAWECADPGVQYDGTINDWHTTPESGRITASNPCFPADQRVVTDKGLVRIGDLVGRAAEGEKFEVYTNDVTAASDPGNRVVATRPVRYMVTGTNEIVELRFSDGSRLRCTPNHRVWTANRGWVHAEQLVESDQVVRSFQYAARSMASAALPRRAQRVGRRAGLAMPDKWSEDLGHLLGWLVGSGRLSGQALTLAYGTDADSEQVRARHAATLRGWTGVAPDVSEQVDGSVRLRVTDPQLLNFCTALGVARGGAAGAVVPDAVFEAPEPVLAAFLRGLLDAAGGVVTDEPGAGGAASYVALSGRSEELLLGVQELLAGSGIAAEVRCTGIAAESFTFLRTDGTEAVHGSDGPAYQLRVGGRSLRELAVRVGFGAEAKAAALGHALARAPEQPQRAAADETVRLVARESQGFETTFNLTEPRNHSYVVSGVVVANCSEYMHLDNSSCNLASLNLLTFLEDDGSFAAERFTKAVEFVITAMDISICFADFPTEAIGDTTRSYRQLGIGYANLGALLMASGLAYDGDGGRALAASITSLMTGAAYKRSAELAGVVGPYDGYARNETAHTRVMRKHQAANDEVRTMHPMDTAVHSAATKAWADCLAIGAENGWRNAQASVLAPTGTIGFMMDCDTTGIEPDFSLVKFKKLVGGGSMQIVNQTVPRALTKLGYQDEQIEAIVEYIAEHGHVIDSPGLRPEHYEVFDCAMGERSIKPMGHVRMMAATQPFLSGAISKTVNLPETSTVEDIADVYFQGWKLGLKALAVYRDNCKVGQPLADGRAKQKEAVAAADAAAPAELARPVRKRLPKSRPSITTSFTVGGAEGYMTAGSYPDDGLGEVFLKLGKQGSTLAGVMDAFSMAISISLQYGVPLETYVSKFTNMKFEPAGMTDDPDVRMSQSIMDYVFRRLALDHLPFEKRAALGIYSADERRRQLETGSYEEAGDDDGELPEAESLKAGSPAAAVVEADASVETPDPVADTARPAPATAHTTAELLEEITGSSVDAPLCFTCGTKMRPAGSCFVCEGCGSTSGCS